MLTRKSLYAISLIWMMAGMVCAQAPANTGYYYQKADGKKGAELKTALYEIIRTPNVVDYDSLWHAYQFSDARPMGDSLIIWDMYSSISRYSIYTKLHGNGTVEGEKGFQREHSLPKSWFNPAAKSGKSLTYKDIWPMYSDLTHVIPAEGKVNNKRSNNPYGENNGEWYTSEESFSKMGACTIPGYAGRCFEPNDEYKGDIARIYFYMVTAYERRDSTWSGTEGIGDHCGTWTGEMFNLTDDDPYQPFAPWAFDMLMRWAKQDPVSQKEIDRNEVCYQLQGNRNPFVDYPGREDYIWGEKKDVAFSYGGEPATTGTPAENTAFALNKTTLGVDWTDNQRDYFERIPISIEKNGVTMTFSYGICGKYMYADTDKIRLYNYNTLSFKANSGKITMIRFTLGDSNHQDKTLKVFTGQLTNNEWAGEEDEVLFTSNYVASKYNTATKTATHYYLELSNVEIEVTPPTGIQQIDATNTSPNVTYTLMGIRIDGERLNKGIYIKNGNKFIVK